jgi:predicted tellurium resistance membrane protein TerC
MDWLDIFMSLVALIILEIILGIDNLVFLTILTEKLPKQDRKRARRWGLLFAWMSRLVLLASAVWLVKLKTPLFNVQQFSFSVRDLFLILGGGFLIMKATQEIHHETLHDQSQEVLVPNRAHPRPGMFFLRVVLQVALMDIIFSLDSVLTAIGLTTNFFVMSMAITIAILVMILASQGVSEFIERYPSIKMLALSFLILIGTVLVADGFALHIPRAYVYFAMGFSLGVESLNLLKRSRRKRLKKES